jgi:hypothetical protein
MMTALVKKLDVIELSLKTTERRIMTIEINSREHWLNVAADIMINELITPVVEITPPLIRYKKGAILGECWNRVASSDGYNEIFITANMDDSLEILAVLLHEQLHAFDNNESGHGAPFQKLCRLTGLIGGNNGRSKNSYTCTVASEPLNIALQAIIDRIGNIPHAAMNTALSGKPKQKNRQLLVKCDTCEFKFRASQKIIDSIMHDNCLSCDTGKLGVTET